MLGLIRKLFDNNEREIARYQKQVVEPTNRLEAEVEKIQDLAAAYRELKEKHEKGASLDELLPMAFALTRESAKRYLACATSTCSSSAGPSSTRARSPR